MARVTWQQSVRSMAVPALMRIRLIVECTCGAQQSPDDVSGHAAACRGCGRTFELYNRDETARRYRLADHVLAD